MSHLLKFGIGIYYTAQLNFYYKFRWKGNVGRRIGDRVHVQGTSTEICTTGSTTVLMRGNASIDARRGNDRSQQIVNA